jgi:hypothetical protein
LKNPSQEKAGGVTQGVGPEFKPKYRKKPKLRNPTTSLYFEIAYTNSTREFLSSW